MTKPYSEPGAKRYGEQAKHQAPGREFMKTIGQTVKPPSGLDISAE
ncbi:MAG: hypothetical protein JST22_08970 [Bacteroidetes bacterium]|nr:hypothetical protein [Bacteroidota bacterium]